MLVLFNKFRLQFLYGVIWMVVSAIQFFVLYLGYNILLGSALADSLIFNFIFAILGVGLWFSTKFSHLQKKNIPEILFHHFITCTILLVVWMLASTSLLGLILNSDEAYKQFLDRSLTMRAFSGILYYGLLVTIYYLIASFRELEQKIIREAQLTTMLKEAELDMLRSQIRPHFLFNSLNAISSLTISRPQQAQDMVIKLSEFMRYSLSQQGELMSTLGKELHHIHLYLGIEQVRFAGKLKIHSEADEQALSWKIPSMLLQPLIENAIKYGVYGSEGESNISLSAQTDQNQLVITILNNFDPDNFPRKGTGTGLQNVRRRLEAIYNRPDLMQINKTSLQFEVTITIPQYAGN